MTYHLSLGLHILGVVVWVGGMFFAYMALRPAAAVVLDGASRLKLWGSTFKHFFPWVWVSIALIFTSGYFILFSLIGGFAKAAAYIHAMHGLGFVMLLIFMHVFFAPYKKLKKAVANEDWDAGAKALAQIRLLILINLSIGILTIVIATLGKSLMS
jgi:uncharacterized membrane protein